MNKIINRFPEPLMTAHDRRLQYEERKRQAYFNQAVFARPYTFYAPRVADDFRILGAVTITLQGVATDGFSIAADRKLPHINSAGVCFGSNNVLKEKLKEAVRTNNRYEVRKCLREFLNGVNPDSAYTSEFKVFHKATKKVYHTHQLFRYINGGSLT